MAMKFAGALFLLLTTSIFAIAIAKPKCTVKKHSTWNGSSYSWSYSYSCGGKNDTTPQVSKTIVVDWKAGFDYQYWAAMKAPFFVNDTLVFKYPKDHEYTVYLMPNMGSYFNCEFTTEAELIGNTTAGAGDGVPFVLKAKAYWLDQNYYFACINHCKLGMKLDVLPMRRY